LIRARWPVLGLAGFVCAGIAIYLATYFDAIAASAGEALAIALAAFAATLGLSGSPRIASVIAAAPIAAAVFALGILAPIAIAWPAMCGILIPHAVATVLLPIAGIAIVIANDFANGVSEGSAPDAGAWSAIARVRLPAILALLVAGLWRGFLLMAPHWVRNAHTAQSTDVSVVAALATAICGVLVCFVLLPLLLGALRPSESEIARNNLLREWGERTFAPLGFLTIPRWALSFCGIAVVFAVMLFFGSGAPLSFLWKAQGLVLAATLFLVGLLGATGLRDWRMFFVCSGAAGFAASFGALLVHGFDAPTTVQFGNVVLPGVGAGSTRAATAALASGLSYLIASGIASFRKFDDPLGSAYERVLAGEAFPVAGIGAAFAVLLWPLGLWALPLACVAAALVFVPVLTAAIEVLFPRLKGVEQLYGKRDAA
jgi:hypothetical protein